MFFNFRSPSQVQVQVNDWKVTLEFFVSGHACVALGTSALGALGAFLIGSLA